MSNSNIPYSPDTIMSIYSNRPTPEAGVISCGQIDARIREPPSALSHERRASMTAPAVETGAVAGYLVAAECPAWDERLVSQDVDAMVSSNS